MSVLRFYFRNEVVEPAKRRTLNENDLRVGAGSEVIEVVEQGGGQGFLERMVEQLIFLD